MSAESGYDFEKLAREIVSSRLKDVADLPAATAEICRRVIVAGILSTQVRQEARLTVLQACRGIMGGLVLIDRDLSEPAAACLKEMARIAEEVHIDPSELMTWGMEGIAQVAVTLGMEVRSSIRERIEENFMGAGTVFSELCDQIQKR